jgi:hypothetical protein
MIRLEKSIRAVRKRLGERGDASLHDGIVFVVWHEHADPPHSLALLLSPRHDWPRRRAAEPRDYLTTVH